MWRGSRRAVSLGGWLLAVACGGGGTTAGTDTGTGAGAETGASAETGTAEATGNPTDSGGSTSGGSGGEAVTYHQHTRPIFAARCAGCHRDEGIGPFSLASYADASMWAEVSLAAVESRRMPPLRADDTDCWPIADARKMAQWEKDLLRQWLEAGTPEGDPKAPAEVEVALPESSLGEPTRVFPDTVTYSPDPDIADQYRCFLIDPGLVADWTFLQAVSVDTDNWSRLHHAIVYAVSPELVPVAEQVDAGDPGEGWTCYFGPQVDGAVPVGSYSPGAEPRPYSGGTSVPVAAGTRFVVEAHFHQTFNQDPVTLAVVSWEFAQPVTRFPHGLSMFNSKFFIPAGAESVTAPLEGRVIPADQEPAVVTDPNEIHEAKAGLVWGVDFHMHMRGKTARIDLVREDGTRQCLLRVPDWDDAWQGPVVFAEPIAAAAGDRFEATCEWDNSAANQPVIDGVQLEPVDLTWGFGALDEMCNANISMTLD